MRLIQYGVAVWLFLAQAAFAAQTPPPQAQYLKIYWKGFHVASLIVGWEEVRGKALAHAAIRTYGLAKAVSRYQSNTISLSEDNIPLKFKTNFSHRKSAREIVLEWRDFTLVKEHNQPPERPGKRTPVSARHKYEAYDPLPAFFVARDKIMDGEKKFVLPMYDGRRRSDLHFKVLGKRKDGTLEIAMKELFIAGYTQREQEERSNRDITIYIYLDPKTYIPVGGIADSVIGTATAELGDACDDFKQCLIKAETE